jgi:hypothetical protein
MMSVTLRRIFRLSKQIVIVATIAVLLVACGGNDEPEAPPTIEATPAAGGMVMPTAVAAAAVQAPAAPQPAVEDVALLVGDAVQPQPDQALRLYNDATAAGLVMSVYGAEARFTVLDPSGDYAVYPVEREGRHWYRLRAPDGLVGWSAADQLVPAN